jgi:hypothetical protein
MRLPLIKYGNIALTTTIIHRARYLLCVLLIVRLGGYIANLSDLYSYRLIGKLTAFLQLQESRFRNLQMEDSSTFDARRSSRTSSQKAETYSLRLQFYVLILT